MRVSFETFSLPKGPSFVVLEGINGCGKTTLLRSLSTVLASRGHQTLETREPGGTKLGSELRKLLLTWHEEPKAPLAELLLFAADRAQHVEMTVRPALQSGKVVLCDRFIYSTIAFQGYGRGIDGGLLDSINEIAIGATRPDLVILIDLDPAIALQRMQSRGTPADLFDSETLGFQNRIRQGFLEIATRAPVPFLVLDGTMAPETLLEESLAAWKA